MGDKWWLSEKLTISKLTFWQWNYQLLGNSIEEIRVTSSKIYLKTQIVSLKHIVAKFKSR